MNFKDIKLFIFDMDGLIFETEKLYAKFIPEVIAEKGYNPDDNLIHSTIGMNTKDTEILYKKFYGDDFPFDFYSSRIYEKLLDYNEKYGLELCEGVLDVLRYFKKIGKPCVLASSSDRSVVNSYLKKNNLEEYFTDITTGDEINNGKPAPDIFLLASKKQNINPKDCMVFEDSYNGIRAANSANMKAIMIPNIQAPTEEMKKLSTLILKNIKEILKYV